MLRITRDLYVDLTKAQIKIQSKPKDMTFEFPEARRDETVKNNYCGVEVPDPYHWLEDPYSEETKKFIKAQNEVTLPYVRDVRYRTALRRHLQELFNNPRFSLPTLRHDNRYYQLKNSGLQNQSVYYRANNLEDLNKSPEVFLNPNDFSKDGTVAIARGLSFSLDGKYTAYGVSEGGSDWYTIKFLKTDTKEPLRDVVKGVRSSGFEWRGNKEIIYSSYKTASNKLTGTATDKLSNHSAFVHKIGIKDDILLARADENELVDVTVSYCDNFLIKFNRGSSHGVKVAIAKIETKYIPEEVKFIKVTDVYEYDYDYITNDSSLFYFHTNCDAPNSKIIIVDYSKPEKNNWKDLIPEDKEAVLKEFAVVAQKCLVLIYLKDVRNVIRIHDLNSGNKIKEIPLELGNVISMYSKRNHTKFFYMFSSVVRNQTVYFIDFEDAELEPKLYQECGNSHFNNEDFIITQEFYKSKDGTQVPLAISHHKNLVKNGENPCMLYGYGGFNTSILPSYNNFAAAFMTSFNGIYVIANIRGGSEYGSKWHEDGIKLKKQNVFDDFQYAAKHLIAHNYTSSKKLIIAGASNGGLLVGACINQAPELFGAALAHVGVMDMLKFNQFTIGFAWECDYGSPQNKEEFEAIFKYSPLHNVKPPTGGQYPATLLVTADHDDRVVPAHSLKFIAELQHQLGKIPEQKNPIMIRVECDAGHGAGKPVSKLINEYVDILCFVGKALDFNYDLCECPANKKKEFK